MARQEAIKTGSGDAANAEVCRQIHAFIGQLPLYKTPEDVAIANGLYFFYERGETSAHSERGRIVRVGNHPRAQNRLRGRLWDHYSSNKNFSVFRKFLGGALLRRDHPTHPCLSPGPGLGHWEKQNRRTCQKCEYLEDEVSGLLAKRFRFCCVEIKDKEQRNMLEKKLIGSLSLCPICQPSKNWLGRSAYSGKIMESGLWNSNHTRGDDTMSGRDLETLRKLVDATLRTSGQERG